MFLPMVNQTGRTIAAGAMIYADSCPPDFREPILVANQPLKINAQGEATSVSCEYADQQPPTNSRD